MTKPGAVHDMYIDRRAGLGTAGGAPCDLVWGGPGGVYNSSVEISNEYGDSHDNASAAPQANLFVAMTNPNYPNGYEGDPIRTGPPSAEYVPMGDSFSTAEGNPSFEFGTDVPSGSNKNICHRSPVAYPRLLQKDLDLNLGTTNFVACSGATIQNVLNGSSAEGGWGEPPQVNALSTQTKTVTITVGGNSMKFSDFATACVFGSCSSSSSQYQESWNIMTDLTRSDYLPAQLAALFASMSSHLYLNPNVKVFVVGYPYVITQASWGDRGVGICSDFDEDEAAAAEAIVLKLDTVLQAAVTSLGDSRFVYVDPLASGSPFLGHELCRGGAYFRGTEAGLENPAFVFHPNPNGQQAYANLIETYMS